MIQNYSTVGTTLFSAYQAVPFMFELRTIIDWTFNSTALTLDQASKLAKVQADMYTAHTSNQDCAEKPLGEEIGRTAKITSGGLYMCVIFLCITVPMILFSGLNPVKVRNEVVSGSLTVSIEYINTDPENGQYSDTPLFFTAELEQNKIFTEANYNAFGFENITNSHTNLYKP